MMIYVVNAVPVGGSGKYLKFWPLIGKYQILKGPISQETATVLASMFAKDDIKRLAKA